jgi:hypothetical protein
MHVRVYTERSAVLEQASESALDEGQVERRIVADSNILAGEWSLSTASFHRAAVHDVVLPSNFGHVRRVESPVELGQRIQGLPQEGDVQRVVVVIHKGLGGKCPHVLLAPVAHKVKMLPRREVRGKLNPSIPCLHKGE